MRCRVGRTCGFVSVLILLLFGSLQAARAATEGAAGGEHHDGYDLSHQNAGPKLEDPSEFKSDLAIWTFVVFLCLLGLLLKFAWRPIIDGLEKRERSIAAMVEDARQSADRAAETLRQYEARLAAAGDEARGMMAQAKREADAAREQIVAQAQAAAQRERQRAVADIEQAKNSALQEMTQKSVELAVLMAGQMVRRELTREDHSRLIREALDQLPNRN